MDELCSSRIRIHQYIILLYDYLLQSSSNTDPASEQTNDIVHRALEDCGVGSTDINAKYVYTL